MSAGRKGDVRGKIFLDMDGSTDQLAGQDGGKKKVEEGEETAHQGSIS